MGTAKLRHQLSAENEAHAERIVSTAITETMLNVKQHAYPEDDGDKYWWLTAAIYKDNLYIVLYDRGVGMPETIKKRSWLRNNFPTINSDHKMIKAAMQYARGSHQDSNPGSGLGSKDIQELVQKSNQGHLTIISDKGQYKLTGGSEKNEKSKKINGAINGTLIEWCIPLNTNQNKLCIIDLAKDFSDRPFGRYLTDDPDRSAEKFRNDLLIPALKKYDHVTVDLSGTVYYGSPFLEETFGGLIRHGYHQDTLKDQLTIKHDKLTSIVDEIKQYMEQAESKKEDQLNIHGFVYAYSGSCFISYLRLVPDYQISKMQGSTRFIQLYY